MNNSFEIILKKGNEEFVISDLNSQDFDNLLSLLQVSHCKPMEIFEDFEDVSEVLEFQESILFMIQELQNANEMLNILD